MLTSPRSRRSDIRRENYIEVLNGYVRWYCTIELLVLFRDVNGFFVGGSTRRQAT